jgi:LysR family hydrogen peroxide-inducible transcriptional activator
MTLTELRYIVAVARERHFGRAAQKCFVSQPTLSIAIRKLEEELGVALFERGPGEVAITPVGKRIVEQAQRVLEEASAIKHIAAAGKDDLAGPLRLGAIYTIGPYLMPQLILQMRRRAPQMPLVIQENYTNTLSDMLKQGELDVIVISLPYAHPGIVTQAVYDEPFRAVVPAAHAWAARARVATSELCREHLLLLSTGNCFRDQVLQLCAGIGRSTDTSTQESLEGSSLETIRQMVASGVGITVLPSTAAEAPILDKRLLAVKPISPGMPSRRVALAWRRSFPRRRAIEALRLAILACKLPGVTLLPDAKETRG